MAVLRPVRKLPEFSSNCKGFSSRNDGPLTGIRVLDLTRILAGPFCTMILGDMGAEIIKVENPDGGDETRRWGPPFVNGESTYFLSVNRNKKSIAVDIKEREGSRLIQQLAMESDIFVENYLPGKLSKFGLDYKNLEKISPHLIYCSITGFGSHGPYSSRAGYDVIAAAMAGLLHATGPEDGEPCKVGVALTDLTTGLYAHGAIMAALLERMKTGCGQKIDCNLLSSQVSLMANLASNFLNANMEAKRRGTSHESIVPYQSFKTSDGYFIVGVGSDKQFKALCKILNLAYLSSDPLYCTNEDRVQNKKSLISILTEKFSTHTTEHWLQVFDGCGIPYGPINNMKQAFEDPQVLYNKMVVDMLHPTSGAIKLPGAAVQFSESINRPRSPPPTFGQHTDDILCNILNLSHSSIEQLRKKKIVV